MTNVRIILCTFPDADTAASTARQLVEEGLAACVNLLPDIRSIYQWDGKVCDESEQLVLIKTTQQRYSDLERRLTELHPYDTPEVLAIPVAAGSVRYLDWVGQSVQKKS